MDNQASQSYFCLNGFFGEEYVDDGPQLHSNSSHSETAHLFVEHGDTEAAGN